MLKKDTKPTNIKLPVDMREEMERICQAEDWTLTQGIKEAIKLFLKEYQN